MSRKNPSRNEADKEWHSEPIQTFIDPDGSRIKEYWRMLRIRKRLFFSVWAMAVWFTSIPTEGYAQTSQPRPTFINERSDVNQDSRVDAIDLTILLQDLMKTTGPEVITIDIPNLPTDARPMRLVRIPAGSFLMGNNGTSRDSGFCHCENCDCEFPRHEVTIGYDFFMSETEVTQAQWEALMESNPSTLGTAHSVGNDYPVYYIAQNAIQSPDGFMARLNGLGQGEFRLPTEAEWEYACRGPESNPNRYSLFSFGDDEDFNMESCNLNSLLDEYMIWCGNHQGRLEFAGSRKPNGFGLYDMHGSVWEWCEDEWHDNYNGAPSDGTAWTSGPSSLHVLRGGTWLGRPWLCKSSFRFGFPPESRDDDIGFRVVLEVPE
ncbi:MAG: formylglycine-generating enzyme family protein [Candidatus Omnitrophica bacterium]|nr:formylglycine-generating enzyme family protein [Candidatus Omnitrophota bacterium]